MLRCWAFLVPYCCHFQAQLKLAEAEGEGAAIGQGRLADRPIHMVVVAAVLVAAAAVAVRVGENQTVDALLGEIEQATVRLNRSRLAPLIFGSPP